MPFPWKKTKITRISRIVADIPSPRHGGSLVVETGFPTSLIDLFFKNRDRLKKPSPKRRSRANRAEPQICDPTSPSSTSLLGFRSSMSRTDSIDVSSQSSIHRIEDSESFEEAKRVGDHGGDRDQSEKCGGVDVGELNGLFAAVLKLFMVVVLALSTKKMAVGITLSAFLLLILEFLGKHAVRVVEPCLNAKSALQSLTRRVSECLSAWKNDSVQRNFEIADRELETKDLIAVEDETEDEFIEEIQIAEPNVDAEERVERIDAGRPEFDFLSRESRWGRLDDGEKKKWNLEESSDDGEAPTIKNKSWKKAKLKAKIIKKLVPKKIRKAKKLKKMKEKEKDFDHIKETSSFFDDDKVTSVQHSEQGDEKPDEEEEEADEDEEEEEVEETGNEEQLRVINGVKGSEREGNKGYIILVLIVLTGLIGGRIPALLLTLAGSFMFKSIKAQKKFPNLGSFFSC